METELSQAYYGVYCSSKEILKNNQRHLFCSMLDLLTSTCKTTGLVGSKIVNDEMIQFWLKDILVLMFDSDRAIQTKAVESFEQGLSAMEINVIHNSKQWPAVKASLTSQYGPKIHKLREDRNPLWYRIWSYMIRILDKELLKGATTINSFLAIVELGFRSTDNTIRAESFLCWRLLIEIFAKYNELTSPKRLKLICIPLKSSQSKSAQAAEVKLRVWWYLLSCLGNKLPEHFETVVEPFLTFCFGGSTSSSSSSKSVVCAAQQYEIVRELALPCLIKLLMSERNESLDRCLRDHKLELLEVPSPLLEQNSLEKKHWKPLANAALEAIRLMSATNSNESDAVDHHILQQLLRQLLHIMLRKDIIELTICLCSAFLKMLSNNPRVVIIMMNTLATEGITLKKSSDNVELFPNLLDSFTKLFIASRSIVPPAILQRCVDQIFSMDYQENGRGKWRLLAILMDKIFLLKDDEDYEAFETKLLMWRNVCQGLVSHLRENSLDVRIKDNAILMEKTILWPLQMCVGFAGRRSNISFDQSFCSQWRQLMATGQNSPERRVFLGRVNKVLLDLFRARHEELAFGELFDAYANSVLKLDSDSNDFSQHEQFFQLMEEILKQQLPKKPMEACLNTLRNTLQALKHNEITKLLDSIKASISLVVNLNAKGSISPIETKFIEEWKRYVVDKLRTHPNKEIVHQMKDAAKGNNDVFVVIPSVWSLNPDKLTERQKERMAEKADIPALYNDMSQSQEASLKPWTPKKIVIAQKDKSEIVLEGPDNDDERQLETDAVTAQREAEKTGTPLSKKKLGKNQLKQQKDDEESKGKTESVDSTPRKTRHSLRRSSISEEKTAVTPIESEDILKGRTRRSGLRNKSDNKKLDDVPEGIKTTTQKEGGIGTSPRKTRNMPISEDVFEINSEDVETPNIIFKEKENLAAQLNTKQTTKPSSSGTSAVREIIEITSDVIVNKDVISVEEDDDDNIQTNQQDVISKTANIDLTTESTIDLTANKVTPNAIAEIIQAKEVSPKKTMPRQFTPLGSPPDRKLTNNSSSPTLRPKPPTSHLTGRGAQLINMIRNKKAVESSLSSTSSFSPAPTVSTPIQQRNPGAELMELTGTDHTSTPVQAAKDFLVFSKRLPSPTASPSASILKRKLRRDSLDDLSFDSPAFKRKRVSFHDPPVSVTKEYIRDADETKAKPKRCLIMDKATEAKHALRRRSKLDSLIEIEKYSNVPAEAATDKATENSAINTSAQSVGGNKSSIMEDSIASLKWHDSKNTSADNPNTSTAIATATATNIIEPMSIEPEEVHVCAIPEEISIDTALKMVTEQCTLDTVLEKYFAIENIPQIKSTNTVAKFLSNAMETHIKIKTNVLETLSENHSKDFLDHAVQENLSSVVCDRLNLNSVIDYICAKSKINSGCRNNLMQQIPDIMKHVKNSTERMEFIKNLINRVQFNDEQILDLIQILMEYRSLSRAETNRQEPQAQHHSTTTSTMVSESAVDSSSNL